ncbi:MAG: hypothetical protein WDM71_04155 [Ferruginibacter sp.]
MKRFFLMPFFILSVVMVSYSQQITYSDPVREDNNTINFDIIGRVGNNIIVFKNAQSKYAVGVYDNAMQLKQKVDLDFMPGKSFNVDYVAYPYFFYLIYQYQKKGIEYCMAAKLNADGQLLKAPFEIDTTKIDLFDDNRIYNTIASEDKQHILIYKSQKQNDQLNFETILLDSGFNVINKSRPSISFDDRREICNNFLLDNNANFIFTKSIKAGNKENISNIDLVTKSSSAVTFSEKNISLDNNYADEVKLKIDNLNKRYIIHSFYYNKRNGDIIGLFVDIWDKPGDTSIAKVFVSLSDSVKAIVNADVKIKAALDNFFIRDVVVKKDGGFIITAEDHSIQSNNLNNPWNRWNYLYGNPFMSPFGSYYFSPFSPYYSIYRPFGSSYYGNQSIRYYYNNILVTAFDNNGNLQWNTVIHKSQYNDNDENSLSYLAFITGSEVHYLFNQFEKKDELLYDNSITPSGQLKINPSIKPRAKAYEFMPRYGKQIGAKKIVVPCTYRNSICFALIEY